MSDRIYCYPDSDVLMNKLNIHDAEKLQEAERKLTMLRLIDLLDRPVVGKFDFKHLQTIFYKGIMPSEKGFRFSSGL